MGGVPSIPQLLQQLRANPASVLSQCRLNVPANISNDPQAIVRHLLNSGQVSQEQLNAVYQQAERMGLRK